MNERSTFSITSILVAACTICVTLALLSISDAHNTNENSTVGNSVGSNKADAYVSSTAIATITIEASPIVETTPTWEIIDRRDILAGKSPQEIGEYAIEQYAVSYFGSTGTPEIALAREVTREELPELKLGCLPDNTSSEEPSYVLVILRGDFSGVRVGKRFSLPDAHYLYAAMVIDVWSPGPTVLIESATGGEFRTALNDPSLPEMDNPFPASCPPRTPGTVPHGALIHGIVFPTSPPEPTVTEGATVTVPPPVPTATIPATGTIPPPVPSHEAP